MRMRVAIPKPENSTMEALILDVKQRQFLLQIPTGFVMD
jgi:hypothetical protein